MSGFTLHMLTNYQPRVTVASPHRSPATGRLDGLFGLWRRRIRGRHALAQLTKHDLHDIRLTRAGVQNEFAKPFRRLAVLGVMSIALAAAPFATATRIGVTAENASVVRIDAAGAYHHARVLEPGTRGSVVEV